jgi:hypothetical protein
MAVTIKSNKSHYINQLVEDNSILNVGYFSDENPKVNSRTGETYTNYGKAVTNEFGTYIIPPRPFMHTTFNIYNRTFLPTIKKLIKSHKTKSEIYNILGSKIKEQIKLTILLEDFAANSPTTILQKGSSHPLIDTKDMMDNPEIRITK